jgi:hemerythrin HHE cation binding domain-containing protein/uncharacterized protein DUF2249
MEQMTEEHRRCDLLLAAAGQALERAEWTAFRVRIVELRAALLAHFAFEEEELFPDFERRTGLREPIADLCLQHRRMREILDALASVAPAHDPQGCRAELDTLDLLHRQHKESEERILHPTLARMREAVKPRAAQAGAAQALDLRGLEPPQPIVRILEALERAPDEPLRVVLPHEPIPLYGLLDQRGFEGSGTALADGGFELIIRRRRSA